MIWQSLIFCVFFNYPFSFENKKTTCNPASISLDPTEAAAAESVGLLGLGELEEEAKILESSSQLLKLGWRLEKRCVVFLYFFCSIVVFCFN